MSDHLDLTDDDDLVYIFNTGEQRVARHHCFKLAGPGAGWTRGERDGSGAARLAAIPAGESPANRGVQTLL